MITDRGDQTLKWTGGKLELGAHIRDVGYRFESSSGSHKFSARSRAAVGSLEPSLNALADGSPHVWPECGLTASSSSLPHSPRRPQTANKKTWFNPMGVRPARHSMGAEIL